MYNNVGKLIEATTDGVTQTWQYDANGNRTHEDGVEVADYDAQDRLTKYKDNTYDYNALGQLTQKVAPSGTNTYDYDVFGNLRGVNLANGDTIDYLIDPRNRRIGKKVNGQVVQKFVYQEQLNPLAELYPDNSFTMMPEKVSNVLELLKTLRIFLEDIEISTLQENLLILL